VRVVLHKSFQHSRLSEDEQILLNNNYFLKPIYVPAYQSVVVIFLFISLVKINLFFLEGYDYSWIVYVRVVHIFTQEEKEVFPNYETP
jgi:hypothetical protein